MIKDHKDYKKILVIKQGAVGNFIAGTAVLTKLRATCPEAKIHLLTNSLGVAMCSKGSLVDDILIKEDFGKKN